MKIRVTIFDGNCGDIDPDDVARISEEMLTAEYPDADIMIHIERNTSGSEPDPEVDEPEQEFLIRHILDEAWERACREAS